MTRHLLYSLSVWLHILGACAWVGSMLFFAAVFVPLLRRPELRAKSHELVRMVAPRFHRLGWISMLVLVLSGLINTRFRISGWMEVLSPGFWTTSFGKILGYKLALVLVVLIATLVHRPPAEDDGTAQDPAALARLEQHRRKASYLGRLVMLLSLVILLLAVALVRGPFW